MELPVEIEEREDEFKAEFQVKHGENLRNEFGRVIGKKISEIAGKPVNHKTPDIVVLLNPFTEQLRLQINPLYISGRYRKLARGIPQAKWICTQCRGKGCPRCGGTGKMYPESVEELISMPILKAAQGTKTSFHASGREDVDARMLGAGRPFVVEVNEPRKRFLDLKALEMEINEQADGKIEVLGLKFADKAMVRRLKKAEAAQKLYRVLVEFDREVSEDELSLLESKLTNTMIRQKTPRRVLHRRANLTREKYIYKVEVKKLTPKMAEIRIRCQGGLYIKELVTGDEGRTIPSVSQILNVNARPLELDVLEVRLKEE
ncbi:MAG TPA: tRNA pseudouridine(54/55) synthase Pus10 [Candidatus Bathyarchaeota archaeon]|nr:tRNA pseudouridine(54/55) synthase Pus10 [Candidatus Bathyarchaeota archaeon]